VTLSRRTFVFVHAPILSRKSRSPRLINDIRPIQLSSGKWKGQRANAFVALSQREKATDYQTLDVLSQAATCIWQGKHFERVAALANQIPREIIAKTIQMEHDQRRLLLWSAESRPPPDSVRNVVESDKLGGSWRGSMRPASGVVDHFVALIQDVRDRIRTKNAPIGPEQ